MSLTSRWTFLLFLAVGIALLLLIALFWQKLFRKGFTNFFLRLTILVITNIILIASIALGINRSQGFYESWGDLLGQGTNYSAQTISYGKTIDTQSLKKGITLAHGYVKVTETIQGKSSGVSNTVTLLLPPSAVQEIKKGKPLNPQKYQVTEFLTGFPSQPSMWFQALGLFDIAYSYNSAHQEREIIAVVPQINIEGNFDLECMNIGHGHLPAETWLTTDMHSYVAQRLGIGDQKWGVVGVSTGGWCAAMFAMKHPELYRGGVSIAGYYRPALPLKDPLALQDEMKVKYDLAPIEAALTQSVPLYVVASLGDKYSIRETTRYLAKPHPNLLIKYHQIASGGHNPRVWRSSVSPALDWLYTH